MPPRASTVKLQRMRSRFACGRGRGRWEFGRIARQVGSTSVMFSTPPSHDTLLITSLWGVHLTGVRSSPRPVLPRALETGRMSAFPRWRGPHGLGTFLARQVVVAHGVMGDGELQDPVKQHPAAT